MRGEFWDGDMSQGAMILDRKVWPRKMPIGRIFGAQTTTARTTVEIGVCGLQLKATVYVLVFSTYLQIHVVTCCIHLRIHRTSRIPNHLQFLRLRRLCSDDSDFSEKSETMCQFFDKRGYPVSVVQAGYHRAQQIDRQSALQTAEKENTDRIPFTLTFHPHNYAVKSIILKNFKSTPKRFRDWHYLFAPHLFHSNVTKT